MGTQVSGLINLVKKTVIHDYPDNQKTHYQDFQYFTLFFSVENYKFSLLN